MGEETILATLIGGAVILGGFALFFRIIIKISTSSVKVLPYRPATAAQPTPEPRQWAPEQEQPRKKKKKAAASVQTPLEPPPPLVPLVKTPEEEVAANALTEEFDLRKAVIMAEILQPKYDE